MKAAPALRRLDAKPVRWQDGTVTGRYVVTLARADGRKVWVYGASAAEAEQRAQDAIVEATRHE